jgi:hypothetical protein
MQLIFPHRPPSTTRPVHSATPYRGRGTCPIFFESHTGLFRYLHSCVLDIFILCLSPSNPSSRRSVPAPLRLGHCISFKPRFRAQVYWECQKATWCEDSHWETSVEPSESRVFQHIQLEHLEMEEFWAPKITSFDKNYRYLVQVYSGRQLSYEGDFLNAFLGISNCLELASGTKFLWGIPINNPAGGFGWYRPSYLNDRWKPRPGKCKIQFCQRLCEVSFPSCELCWVSFTVGTLSPPICQSTLGDGAHLDPRGSLLSRLPSNIIWRPDWALRLRDALTRGDAALQPLSLLLIGRCGEMFGIFTTNA